MNTQERAAMQSALRELDLIQPQNMGAHIYRAREDLRAVLAQPTQPQGEPVAWRCFHCAEEFTDREAAALHFGASEFDKPACQFSVEHIRWMEAQHRRNVGDDSEALRAIGSLVGEHERLRTRAEEEGYAKGLRDAKKHPEELGLCEAPQRVVQPAQVAQPPREHHKAWSAWYLAQHPKDVFGGPETFSWMTWKAAHGIGEQP
jgi:hypothetical protein